MYVCLFLVEKRKGEYIPSFVKEQVIVIKTSLHYNLSWYITFSIKLGNILALKDRVSSYSSTDTRHLNKHWNHRNGFFRVISYLISKIYVTAFLLDRHHVSSWKTRALYSLLIYFHSILKIIHSRNRIPSEAQFLLLPLKTESRSESILFTDHCVLEIMQCEK